MTWNYAYTPHIWPSIFTILLLIALAIYAWRRRSVAGEVPFTIGCLWDKSFVFKPHSMPLRHFVSPKDEHMKSKLASYSILEKESGHLDQACLGRTWSLRRNRPISQARVYPAGMKTAAEILRTFP
jgi:hypothetical protein